MISKKYVSNLPGMAETCKYSYLHSRVFCAELLCANDLYCQTNRCVGPIDRALAVGQVSHATDYPTIRRARSIGPYSLPASAAAITMPSASATPNCKCSIDVRLMPMANALRSVAVRTARTFARARGSVSHATRLHSGKRPVKAKIATAA